MNEYEIIKHVMMLNNVTYDGLSDRLGYKSKSTSFNTLNGNHIRFDTWKNYLNELGYDIVVRKRESPNEEYVVDDDIAPSPLRFQGMDLNLGVIFGEVPPVPKKRPVPTFAERTRYCRELKDKIQELTFAECCEELRKIWKHNGNAYSDEYEKNVKEFAVLYGR